MIGPLPAELWYIVATCLKYREWGRYCLDSDTYYSLVQVSKGMKIPRAMTLFVRITVNLGVVKFSAPNVSYALNDEQVIELCEGFNKQMELLCH